LGNTFKQYCHLVHRLDCKVSGLSLIGLDKEAIGSRDQ